MHPSKRLMWMVSIAAVVVLAAACGGQPADEPAAAEEPAAVEEPTPVEEPVVEPDPVPEEPVQPVITGNIVEVGTGAFDWLNAATREVPGRYYWQVQLRNDTTATLDITVTWTFLDEAEQEVKTDRKTVRVEPAATGTFRVEGEMERDDARAVAYTSYTWDYEIVQGG